MGNECTVGKKKGGGHPINSNTKYHRGMKLIPINMDYCLLQFDAVKFFLCARLHGVSLQNLNFFNVNPPIGQRNRKVHHSNCQGTNFHNISGVGLRVIRRRNYN